MVPRESIKARVKRLDRIAGELNAWLLVMAFGLAVVDFTVMVTLYLPSTQADQGEDARNQR
jgi:hypothetical protein